VSACWRYLRTLDSHSRFYVWRRQKQSELFTFVKRENKRKKTLINEERKNKFETRIWSPAWIACTCAPLLPLQTSPIDPSCCLCIASSAGTPALSAPFDASSAGLASSISMRMRFRSNITVSRPAIPESCMFRGSLALISLRSIPSKASTVIA
jgi:hypothetical protein